MQIVLASQSPYRRAQLETFGLKFIAEKPAVNEDALKATGPKDLRELTLFLARAKAESLKDQYPQAVILGSDQIAMLENERLDKPGTHERAKAQLLKMQGKTHHLITSLAVIRGSETQTFTDVTEIRMKALSEGFIEAYLEKDQPYDCAGSYKIEKAGLGLVEELKTQDPSAIQGLPLLSLVRALAQLGIPLPMLWRNS